MPSYDSAWKDLLDRFLELVLLFFFPELAAEVDWSKGYDSLDTQLRKIVPEGEVGDRLADRLVKAKAKDSGDPRLMHFEAQGKTQHEFGRRVFRYNYRAFDMLAEVPESLVILADDDPDWRPTGVEVRLKYTTLTFAFRVAKLLDYLPRLEELRKHENLVGLFFAHLEAQRTVKDVKARSDVKLGLLLELAARKLDEEDRFAWYKMLDLLLGLPPDVDRAVYREAARLTREQGMPFVTTAERYGREQGEIMGLLAGLRTVLRLRFASQGEALLPALEAIDDPQRLAALLALAETASLDDFRREAGI